MADLSKIPIVDIELPDAPGIWPLGPGWWFLIVAIALIAYVFYKSKHLSKIVPVISRPKGPSARKEAIKKMNRLTTDDGVAEITELLRQAALSYYPREQVAGLTEADWLVFLDDGLPEEHKNFVNLIDYWMTANYSAAEVDKSIFEVCRSQALIWLEHALPPAKKSRPKQDSNPQEKRSKGVDND
ncbi:DUF4381 domain-containing protein [Veronia pacifica]|uniref:DUF4381 domain-containing protein n=1 Tax=Veronia pacifica TaxID=1080227 RepID=A0A1C3EMK2_9GAMM|nr:DUF4381 domain-containing protein [Veronia pacifica]ODA34466.1 hypothetical protein A8L45_05705 [Veronia pacifica]